MSKKAKGITVVIGGDTTKLGKALEDVDKQSRSLKTELKGVNTLLKMDPKNVTLIKQKQDLLNTSIKTTRERLDTLKAAQAQVQEQFDKGEITEEQYRDFQREIAHTESKLKSLEEEAKKFGSTASASILAASEKVNDFGKSTEELGKKMMGASLVATGALVGSGKAAIDFESAWAGVMKTVDGTPEQMDSIRESILKMSGELPASAEEIAEVAENAGQLGIETDSVLSFTQTMIDMGEATNMSADTASVSLARFANITQMSQKDFDRLGSTVVNLGNNLATTEGEIVEMSLRLAGTGAQVGLSESQIMGLSATMASLGINAEAGGSSMSRVMQKMNTQVMSNGKTLKGFAKVSGMSSKEFQKAWQEDASGALVEFVKGLGKVKESGGDVTTTLKDLGISSTQEIDTLLRMSGASDVLTDSLKLANEGWEENSALTTEATTRYETTESKMKMLGNKIKAVAIQLGDILLPIIQKVVDAISGWIDKFNGLSDTMKIVIVAVLGIIAALGPVLIVIGKIAQGVSSLMVVFAKLLPILKIVGGLFLTTTGLIVAAVVGVVAAIIYLWNTSETFRNFWIGLWETIRDSAVAAWEWIKETWSTASEFFTGLWGSIQEIFAGISEFIIEAWTSSIEWIKAAWDSLTEFFTTLWTTISEGAMIGFQFIIDKIMLIVDPFIETFTLIWDNLSEHLSLLWENIQIIAMSAWEIIKNVILGPVLLLIDILTGDFEGMKSHLIQIWDNIKESATLIWEAIKETIVSFVTLVVDTLAILWDNLKTNVSTVFNAIKTFLIETWTNIKNTVIHLANDLKDGAIKAWETLKNTVTNLGNQLKQLVSNIWTNMKNTVVELTNKLKDGTIKAWETLKNTVTNLGNQLKQSVSNIWTNMKNSVIDLANKIKDGAIKAWNTLKDETKKAFNKVVDFIKDPLGDINLFDIGKDIINGLIDGIKSMAGAVGKAVSNVAGNIKDTIKGALNIFSPSRWMRDEVGKMIPAGIGVGIEENTDDATEAVDVMADKVKESSTGDMINLMNGRPTFETSHAMRQNMFNVTALQQRLDDMLSIMGMYLPHLSEETQIILDTGAVVGGIKYEMNRQQSDILDLNRRGR